jgi:hypothetical protein
LTGTAPCISFVAGGDQSLVALEGTVLDYQIHHNFGVTMSVITYPDSAETFTLGMDVDDPNPGKLLKHSLMTDIRIERPLTGYLKKADRTICHLSDVPLQR